MPTKKKKFIDKKNAITFHVVHRSQKDPLLADENAPKHVLVEDISKEKEISEKRKEQQRKYGIYFDDEYDYLKHLKDVDSVPDCETILERVRITESRSSDKGDILQLPSSVFQSSKEEKEGLLNKIPTKGPRPDWDPDIVAALDCDFDDSDNQLEDDFVSMANGAESEEHTDGSEGDDEREFDDEAESDDSFSCANNSFTDEDTKSRFTRYSLTSSVLPRSEALEFLDEKFEKMLEKYEELDIGSLDGEEITGYIHPNSMVLTQMAEDFEKQKQTSAQQEVHDNLPGSDAELNKMENIFVESDKFSSVEEDSCKVDKWDCESILSTHSNYSNHPKLIKEPEKVPIKICEKTGIPSRVLATRSLTKRQLRKLQRIQASDEDSSSNEANREKSTPLNNQTKMSIRPKTEMPEERRIRKTAVKLMRKERRIEKKSNKLAFKEEKKLQEKISQNIVHNLQSIKLL